MALRRDILVLQAVGPEAALLRMHPDPAQPAKSRIEVLGTFHAAGRSRDTQALADENLVTALGQCVRDHHLVGCRATILLGGALVASHHIKLPKLQRPAALKAIRLKLAKRLPYEVARATIAVEGPMQPAAEGAAEYWYQAASAPTELLDSTCAAATKAGLHVDDVLPASAAVEALLVARLHERDEQPIAAAFLDESATTLVVCQKGLVTVINELPAGLADLTAAMMRPIIAGEQPITLSEAEARRFRDTSGIPELRTMVEALNVPAESILPLLEPVLQQWGRSFTQWLTFTSASDPSRAVQKLFLTGPGAAVPGLATALDGRVPADIEVDKQVSQLFAAWQGQEVAESADSMSPVEWIGLAPSSYAIDRGRQLPSLLPGELRRARRLRSILNVTSICGLATAAALLIAAIAIFRAGNELQANLAANTAVLQQSRSQLARFQQNVAKANRIEQWQNQVDTFTKCVPDWPGVMKVLAETLPQQMVLRQIQAERKDNAVEMLVTALVFRDETSGGLDRVIQGPLRSLQASPFFESVEVVSAGDAIGGLQPDADRVELRLKMRVVFPTTLKPAPAKPTPPPPASLSSAFSISGGRS